MKNTVIPNKISVSFQMIPMDAPLSIMDFMMMINHFAGMILLIICKGRGILEIGKIKPESMITGSINPIKDSIIAVCCVFEMVEIRIPKDSADMINKILSRASRNRLPSMGIPNTNTPKDTITTALITERKI
jgi:hypothetical protein